jgi:hypothetical protein
MARGRLNRRMTVMNNGARPAAADNEQHKEWL